MLNNRAFAVTTRVGFHIYDIETGVKLQDIQFTDGYLGASPSRPTVHFC